MEGKIESRIWLSVGALFTLLFVLIMCSCSKEEENTCKDCTIKITYESDSLTIHEDSTSTECNNPQNETIEIPAEWEHNGKTYSGTKRTAKRCKSKK